MKTGDFWVQSRFGHDRLTSLSTIAKKVWIIFWGGSSEFFLLTFQILTLQILISDKKVLLSTMNLQMHNCFYLKVDPLLRAAGKIKSGSTATNFHSTFCSSDWCFGYFLNYQNLLKMKIVNTINQAETTKSVNRKLYLSVTKGRMEQGIASSIYHMILSRSTVFNAIVILLMSIFLFSCEIDDHSNDADVKIEIPVKEDYLSFTSYDQFTQFLKSRDDFATPESFQSLSSYLSMLLKDYHKDGSNAAELSKYYMLIEGRVPKPEYKFYSFVGVLNQDKMVEIEGKLYKFDFDEVKLASQGNISDFDSESTYTIEHSQVERRFHQNPTRSVLDVNCGYAFEDLNLLFGSIFASLNIHSNYPLRAGYTIFQMWPDPSGTDNIGATISYPPSYSHSINWQTYQCPAAYEGQYIWPQFILNIPAPCTSKNITLDLPYTRANWLGATAPEDECEGLVQLFGLSKQFYGCN